MSLFSLDQHNRGLQCVFQHLFIKIINKFSTSIKKTKQNKREKNERMFTIQIEKNIN